MSKSAKTWLGVLIFGVYVVVFIPVRLMLEGIGVAARWAWDAFLLGWD